jgi:flagellar biosynthesis protein FlhF
MQHELFRGRNMREAMAKVRAAMGDEAMILFSRSVEDENGAAAEIAAAPASAVDSFRIALNWGSPDLQGPDVTRVGPRYIALVGPPGAGKTLTAVKIALSEHGFGGRDVGFITLDTYRVGAVDELQTYAELAGIPLEVVYHRREVDAALQRLRHCRAVLVDTPGRTPDAVGKMGPWEDLLRLINPHEVHLVLPAGLRIDVADSYRRSIRDLGFTHFLPTKLDHVPWDVGLAELVQSLGLPTRWVADGHEVPHDLRPAGPRILTSLGRPAPQGAEDPATRAVS